MAKTAKSPTPKKSTAAAEPAQSPRVLPKRQYKTFRLGKPIRRPKQQKLPSSWALLRETWALLCARKGFFVGVVAVYGVLQLILVTGVVSSGTAEVRDALLTAADGVSGALLTSLTLTTYVATTTGQAGTDQGSVYQLILIVIASLAVIWALRHVESLRTSKSQTDEKVRIRDAYYKGMAPLVPFILVLVVILLEFIPLLIGSWLYSVVIQGGIAVTFIEQLLWGVFLLAFAVLTIYLVLSSLFALLIVTLPNVTPMQALRSARGLVLHRRWELIRKFLFLAVVTMLVLLAVMMPIALWLPAIAPWLLYTLFTALLAVALGYAYVIYRELLRRD